MRRPINSPYTVTTQFGVPDSNALFGKHSGIDYAVPLNWSVYAPASGKLYNVNSPTGGRVVRIYDGKMWHRLMHNNSFSRTDGPVKEGDEVAKAGTTGLSTGVHVHWDVANKMIPTSFSDFVNPEEYIKSQEDDMPNEGDAINFIRAEKMDPNYNPTKAEIEAARKVSGVDWAYRIGYPNDGDAVNYAKKYGGEPKEAKKFSNKTWAYRGLEGDSGAKVLEPGTYKVN